MRWLLVLLALSACTTTTAVQTDAASSRPLTGTLAAETVRLHLAGGSTVRALSLRVEPDSVSWIDPDTRTLRRAATAEVASVETVSRTRGALRGAATAAVVAGVTTAVVSFVALRSTDCTPGGFLDLCGADSQAALSLVIGGSAAAFPGAAVGALVGERDRWNLAPAGAPLPGQ